MHADGRFLLADFDVSKDTLGAASGSPQEAGPGLGPASSPCTASGIGNGKHSAGGGGENGMAEQGGVSGPGDGSAIVPGFAGGGGDVCGMSEAMTTRTSVAGTQGFMAPEVKLGCALICFCTWLFGFVMKFLCKTDFAFEGMYV